MRGVGDWTEAEGSHFWRRLLLLGRLCGWIHQRGRRRRSGRRDERVVVKMAALYWMKVDFPLQTILSNTIRSASTA